MLDLFENLCTELNYGSLSGRDWNWVGKPCPNSLMFGLEAEASVYILSMGFGPQPQCNFAASKVSSWSGLTHSLPLISFVCLFMSQLPPRCCRYSRCCQVTRPTHSKDPFSSTLNWKCFHVPECSLYLSTPIPSIFIFFVPSLTEKTHTEIIWITVVHKVGK